MKKLIPLLLFICLQLSAQTDQYDALLDGIYKSGEPGAAVLIAKGDNILYRRATGMADLENNVALTPNHVFEIGSITKQFTAVSILMLVEEGKIALNDPVTKYIKDYPMNGHTITIHHLLTHTSGIKSYTGMESWTKLWRLDKSPQEMIDLFKNEPMEFAPGEKWNYNNSAYFMLGYVIENASGMPYPEFLEKKIFIPLGMKNSYYGSQTKIIPNRAQGYQKDDKGFINAEYLSLTQPYAAGSIMSTVDDLFTWSRSLRNHKLIKPETLQKAVTDYKLNNGKSAHYGYGWGINEINGSTTYEHSGGIFGYTANGIYLPKEDIYVIMLTNRNDVGPSEVSTKMAAVALGKPYTKTESKAKLDEKTTKGLIGVYDFEENVSRVISYEDGKFFSQRIGGPRFEIYPQDKTHFKFEDPFTSYEFIADKAGVIKEVIFKNRIDVSKGIKTNKPIPAHNEVKVDDVTLKNYVGVYEIQPGFNITVSLEDGHLMTQATGQQKFEVFPESQTKFFLKVVDAQIEFIKEEGGKYSLLLHQGGRQIPGKRKD